MQVVEGLRFYQMYGLDSIFLLSVVEKHISARDRDVGLVCFSYQYLRADNCCGPV